MLNGFKVAAVGVVLQAFWGLSEKYRKEKESVIMFVGCALVYTLLPTVACMFTLFGIAVGYCLYFKDIELKAGPSNKSKLFDSVVFGKFSALAFFGLLALSFVLKGGSSTIENEMAIFYKIGSIIIGGGHVILPMMWTEFKPYGYFE